MCSELIAQASAYPKVNLVSELVNAIFYSKLI